jgi:hypothetical protein
MRTFYIRKREKKIAVADIQSLSEIDKRARGMDIIFLTPFSHFLLSPVSFFPSQHISSRENIRMKIIVIRASIETKALSQGTQIKSPRLVFPFEITLGHSEIPIFFSFLFRAPSK